jgi:hypothetical protein
VIKVEVTIKAEQKHVHEGAGAVEREYQEVGLMRCMTVRIPRGIAEAVGGLRGFMLTDSRYYQIQRREVKEARA